MVVWALELSSQTSVKAVQEKHLPKQKSDAEAFHATLVSSLLGWGN